MAEGASLLGRPVGSRGEDTRRRIIAAAMQCVAEMGYARATIKEIAKAAGITSGSLYHYFPNKAEIVLAAYVDVSEATMPALLAAAEQADGLVERLAAVIRQGGRIMQEYPFAVAFDRAVRAPGVGDEGVLAVSDNVFASLRNVVQGAVQQAALAGELNPQVSPQGAANAVYALMRGLYDVDAASTPEEFDATVQAVLSLLQGTLVTRRGRPGPGGAPS